MAAAAGRHFELLYPLFLVQKQLKEEDVQTDQGADNEDAMEVLLSPEDMETSEEQRERRDEYLALLYMK